MWIQRKLVVSGFRLRKLGNNKNRLKLETHQHKLEKYETQQNKYDLQQRKIMFKNHHQIGNRHEYQLIYGKVKRAASEPSSN